MSMSFLNLTGGCGGIGWDHVMGSHGRLDMVGNVGR